MAVNPSLIPLWLAEEVIHDEDTGRTTVHGIFNQIDLPSGTTEYSTPFVIFFSVTDVRSRCTCQLKLSDPNLAVIHERLVHLDSVGPSEVTDMTIHVNQMPVRDPGSYVWDLFFESDLLGSTRLMVRFGD